MTHRKSIEEYPLVLGGQGRSGDEVRESAMRIAWVFWAFAAVLVGTAIAALITGLFEKGVT